MPAKLGAHMSIAGGCEKAVWAAVHDELQTLPFLGGHRLVVVDAADPFVTKHRAALEKYLAAPASTGVLVLDVKSWPANTRLAKLIDGNGTLVCKAPPAARLPEWCARWCEAEHGKQLRLLETPDQTPLVAT